MAPTRIPTKYKILQKVLFPSFHFYCMASPKTSIIFYPHPAPPLPAALLERQIDSIP